MATTTLPERTAVSGTTVPRARGRVRLGTLSNLRWLAIAGQSAALLIVNAFLELRVPLILCVAPIAVSVLINTFLAIAFPSTRRLSAREATAFLAYDIVQLGVLLFMTGGIENPFALLFIAPVVVSAATLDVQSTFLLGTLSFIGITILAFVYFPLPWFPGETFTLPALYVAGIWISLVMGVGFTAMYAWRTANESVRMSAALAATQLALAREHRMSALGALAAGAAHELGTPLGTIALVAHELERDLPEGSHYADDLRLLRTEADRCRDIITRLAQPEESVLGQAERMPLGALLDDMAAPHREVDVAIIVDVPQGVAAPKVWRVPEIRHGIGNLIENAADFAKREVILRARWDEKRLSIDVIDDGPGFSMEIFEQIGEPYITSRPRKPAAGDTAPFGKPEGMGLGFFIAKTLIERTGGTVVAKNRAEGGAMITASWPRGAIDGEAPPSPDLSV